MEYHVSRSRITYLKPDNYVFGCKCRTLINCEWETARIVNYAQEALVIFPSITPKSTRVPTADTCITDSKKTDIIRRF